MLLIYNTVSIAVSTLLAWKETYFKKYIIYPKWILLHLSGMDAVMDILMYVEHNPKSNYKEERLLKPTFASIF